MILIVAIIIPILIDSLLLGYITGVGTVFYWYIAIKVFAIIWFLVIGWFVILSDKLARGISVRLFTIAIVLQLTPFFARFFFLIKDPKPIVNLWMFIYFAIVLTIFVPLTLLIFKHSAIMVKHDKDFRSKETLLRHYYDENATHKTNYKGLL
ncbi:hypothetical protein H9M94_00635 [Mycoplasma sp. Pen4]|uniref:hypothetical protein n=1 Tax=Mycoplasma sp. Pen4 TaxID=640330 RepID=UPI0016543E35|nr:hypothetical protein [Mycoplasma sp. Pen4]QNM93770.1 hypothetical protein H9M94_00635 [Mycoplasma sp. Pen4]